ncbi:Na+/H+ antiporter subunit E [sulfur-oxidizing endosymbiont of Gigantopelta aegis]|uniref:Na+/H+ antiporter subunit E n=1 Tax=sulfur-oxidizing endosymbiont of Gigantopelta aegis TaxID=2794934 RepID=UPI0018DD7F1F|nr:Na+/H+ antiporter subunit E [sulfur-oxidizing endosymbiont of Gigantopelta aegis]
MSDQSPPYISTFIICFILWLLLTASFKGDELITGFVVAAFISSITAKNLSILNGMNLSPKSPIALVRYLVYFMIELVKANLDLASRVLSKKIPLDPTMIEIKTSMQSELGRLLLANSITLTPGTLSVDVKGERILVHWIDCYQKADLVQATEKIAQGFERHLKGFVK